MSTTAPTESAAPPQAVTNAVILAVANAIVGSYAPVIIISAGLAGAYLLGPDKSLATLPVAGMSIGIALGALPAAALMRRVGRRIGLFLGALIGVLGSLIAAGAIFAGAFWVLVLGTIVMGISGAFVQQYRFAAADAGGEAFKAKAISWVLVGGVASAFIGPQVVIHLGNLFDPVQFAGGFVGAAVLCAIGAVILLGLGGVARYPIKADTSGAVGRPMSEIARQPRFVISVACGIASFALMSLLMTAAPLAMVGCGLTQQNAAVGIQWHVLAMFAPSFITGSLIARFGAERIVAIGLGLLAISAAIALAGLTLLHFWSALIVLGLGWNFGFIGATAMLTSTYRPVERTRVQGLNDFLVFGFVALASLLSGKLLSAAGWATINVVVFPIVIAAFLGLGWLALQSRPKTA
jgi:MFS family permease